MVLDDRELNQCFVGHILRSTFTDNPSSFSLTHRKLSELLLVLRDINTDSWFTRRQRAGRQNKAGGGKVREFQSNLIKLSFKCCPVRVFLAATSGQTGLGRILILLGERWEVGLLSFTIYASAPAILLLSPVLRTPAFPTKIDALGIDLAGAGGGCRPLSVRAGGT